MRYPAADWVKSDELPQAALSDRVNATISRDAVKPSFTDALAWIKVRAFRQTSMNTVCATSSPSDLLERNRVANTVRAREP